MDEFVADRSVAHILSTAIVKKRSVVVQEHKTSISLEDEFWDGLKEIASLRETGLSELVNAIDAEHRQTNLSSAIRLFVLDHYRSAAAALAKA
jgi:predicted DNA-binding ribbon-helix-helix protein